MSDEKQTLRQGLRLGETEAEKKQVDSCEGESWNEDEETMSVTCGKAGRKHGGNRFDVKRRTRIAKHTKKMTNNVLSPDQYRKMKLSDRKQLDK